MPGTFIVKASQHPFLEGQVEHVVLPPLPAGRGTGVLEIEYTYEDLKPMVGAPYRIEFNDGTQIEGKLDDRGRARIENPPGTGAVYFGEDERPAFPYPERPTNPLYGFRPSTPEDAAQAIERYAAAEAEYMEDNYFPDEIAALYEGTMDYQDLLAQYQYAEEAEGRADEALQAEDEEAEHEEILLSDSDAREPEA